ncbi:MAG TPA: 4-aminobutyrate--2-oxoglutarate transaminase [Negativicutes bacterium]
MEFKKLEEDLILPGPKAKQLLARRSAVVSNGVSNSVPVFIEKAKGALMRDIDGHTFLDFYGGIGVLNVGHCPKPVVKAIQEQADNLLHSCFMVSMYESYVVLAEKLTACAPGKSPKKALLLNSGSEAVENAVKIARYVTQKKGIVSFECAFHGRTYMAMSLTSKVKPYKFGFGPFVNDTYKIPFANCYRCPYQCTYPGCGLHCLERIKTFFAAQAPAEEIAAIIVEPVQGEGGFLVPPKEFLPGLKEICEKNNILFIADEVQSGFARTGMMFAIEHWGIEPDLMTVAKSIAAGMPLSGVIGKAALMDMMPPGSIGGTYGGNPLACVAANATLDYIKEQKLVERANHIGEKAITRFKNLQDKYEMIGDVRGLGAMVAVELVKDRQTKEPAKDAVSQILDKCTKRGVLALNAGIYGNVIRLLMPLVITDEQLDLGLTVIEEAMAEVLH